MSDHEDLCLNLYANPEGYAKEAVALIEQLVTENAHKATRIAQLEAIVMRPAYAKIAEEVREEMKEWLLDNLDVRVSYRNGRISVNLILEDVLVSRGECFLPLE